MECVGDQADDQVVLGDGGVEGLVVSDIKRDRVGELDALGELLSSFYGSASYMISSQQTRA